MESPPFPPDERKRLKALESYGILDTQREAAYDDVTALAALICEAPFSLITLVDENRQWFKSRHGWEVEESDRAISFCAHAIVHEELMVVPDAKEDPRFQDNPDVVEGPEIRFYAGAPLVNPEGHALGTLCVLDQEPRALSKDQEQALKVLRTHVMTLFELRRSSRRLDLTAEILNSLPGVFYVIDREGGFLRWNRRFEELTGYSAGEFSELRALDLFEGADRDHVEERIRRVFDVGVADAEAELVAKDGTAHAHYFTGRRLVLEGEPCLVGMGVDVTRRRELEEERRQLFQVLPDPLCVVGFDGRFRDVNPAWERVLGYSPEALLGRAFMDFVHPDDLEFTREEFERNLEGVETGGFENRYRHRDGGWRWMSWNSSVDSAREVIYGVARDVSERKKVARTLRESEKRYRTLVESARDAILTLAPDGTIASVNRAFEAITGWEGEAWLGRSYEDLLRPDTLPLAREVLGKLFREGEMPVFEVSVRDSEGHFLPVEIKAAALEWVGGGRRALVVARDVRERKALDERLQRIQRLDAVGRLAAGVAHDFNNVLAVIRGEADLLLLGEETLPDSLEEGLRQIREAADQGAGLTSRLMALSRDREIQLRPVELNDVVDRFAPMLQRYMGSACHVETNLSPEDTTVRADPGSLEQVLMNLAINARDAMPDGGTFLLSTSPVELDEEAASRYPDAGSGRYVRLSVGDTGSGISPEDLPRIFEPLFTTKEEGEGTGLGLATVFSLIRQQHGWMDVESTVGEGTTFHAFLPVAD
ncbi:MAG: PAS domain S-box protein [Gemmatimonadota bacterium]